ncbi:MAG TPA: hypothetical protein VHN59_04935 [Chitinophagaceae bacterium]|nr:hypothetical protein [Chitinophagaceae bacterium]
MLKCSVLFLGLLFGIGHINAQITIQGIVSDSLGKPVAGVNVTSTGNKPSGPIKAFSITGVNGAYILNLSAAEGDSIFIKVSYVGYATVSTIVKAQLSTTIHFTLHSHSIQLPEVMVKNLPVYVKEDTINYDVAKFKNANDRVVSDVLRKMPGIDVAANGQIYYQGRPIQQLTVEGLNLMESQYGMISNNLGADAVSRVQVIENDQRIKALDSLVPSDQTTINLKLKKYAVAGNLEVGAGVSPFLRHIKLTPLIFKKDFQMLHSFASNNTGDDQSEQLRSMQVGGTFSNNNGFRLTGISHIISTTVPAFNSKRWLDNDLNQVSSNILKKLNNDWIFKLNLAYINDHQKQFASTTSVIYPEGQAPVTISEEQKNTFNISKLLGNIAVEKNVKAFFFRNNLTVNASWVRNTGNLERGPLLVRQQNMNEPFVINNRLTVTRPIKKQVVTFNSIFNYSNLPERLLVSPGPFAELLNGAVEYDQAIQRIRSSGFNTDNSVSFTRRMKNFVLSTKLGAVFSSIKLNSGITTYTTGDIKLLDTPFQNLLRLTRLAGYAAFNGSYEFKKGYVSLGVPMQLMHLSMKNQAKLSKQELIFQPSLYGEFRIKNSLKFYSTLSKTDTFATDPSTLYPSYILSNYRTITKYPQVFANTKTLSGIAGIEYKNILSGFWMNLDFGLERSRTNILYNIDISPDGAGAVEALLNPNAQVRKRITAAFSKIIPEINTIVKLGGTMLLSSYKRVLNQNLLHLQNRSFQVQPGIISTVSKHLSASYNSSFSFIRSRSGKNEPARNVVWQDHKLEINITPVERHVLITRFDYYSFGQASMKGQQFLDIIYRFTAFKKRKTDFELRCQNLLNTKQLYSFYTDGYTTTQSNYTLRPRQILLIARLTL